MQLQQVISIAVGYAAKHAAPSRRTSIHICLRALHRTAQCAYLSQDFADV